MTGYFTSSTITIGTTTLTNLGGTDVFICKFDPSGNIIWAKQFAGSMNEEGNGITCDANNNVFLTGMFESGMIPFASGTLSPVGSGDVYIAKYDNNGNEIWAKNLGGLGMDISYAVSTTTLNDIYITGSFRSASVTFSSTLLSNQGGADYFIARYDGSGNEMWAKDAGGNFDDAGHAILCTSNGIYTTGYFKSTNISFGTTTFTNAGVATADVFLIDYTSLGMETWTHAYGGNQDEIGYGLAFDPASIGKIYLSGHIHSPSVVFGTYTLNCNGVGDAFVVKYDWSANLLWADNIGGIQDEGISSLAIDGIGNVFATGSFYSPSVNFSSNTINNNGNSDLFVAKLLSTAIGIKESSDQDNGPILYPNPASEGFYLNRFGENSLIQLFDITGKTILEKQLANDQQEYIEIKNLSKGIYFVKITTGEYLFIKKLIIN